MRVSILLPLALLLHCALFSSATRGEEIIKVTWFNSASCSQGGNVKEVLQPGFCYNYNSSTDYPSSGEYYFNGNIVYYTLYIDVGCDSFIDDFNYTALTCYTDDFNNNTFMFFIQSSTTTASSSSASSASSTSSSASASTSTSISTASLSTSTTSSSPYQIVDYLYQSSNCSGTAITNTYQLSTCVASGGSSIIYTLSGNNHLIQCEYSDQYCSVNGSCNDLGLLNTCVRLGSFSIMHTLSPTTSTTSITPTTTYFPTSTSTSIAASTSATATTVNPGEPYILISTYSNNTAYPCGGWAVSSTMVPNEDCIYLNGMSMRYIIIGNSVFGCLFPDEDCSTLQKCNRVADLETCTLVGSTYYYFSYYPGATLAAASSSSYSYTTYASATTAPAVTTAPTATTTASASALSSSFVVGLGGLLFVLLMLWV